MWFLFLDLWSENCILFISARVLLVIVNLNRIEFSGITSRTLNRSVRRQPPSKITFPPGICVPPWCILLCSLVLFIVWAVHRILSKFYLIWSPTGNLNQLIFPVITICKLNTQINQSEKCIDEMSTHGSYHNQSIELLNKYYTYL